MRFWVLLVGLAAAVGAWGGSTAENPTHLYLDSPTAVIEWKDKSISRMWLQLFSTRYAPIQSSLLLQYEHPGTSEIHYIRIHGVDLFWEVADAGGGYQYSASGGTSHHAPIEDGMLYRIDKYPSEGPPEEHFFVFHNSDAPAPAVTSVRVDSWGAIKALVQEE